MADGQAWDGKSPPPPCTEIYGVGMLRLYFNNRGGLLALAIVNTCKDHDRDQREGVYSVERCNAG